MIARDGKSILMGVITFEDRPATELMGKLELVRLDASNGNVVGRTKLVSGSRGSTAWFEQPRLAQDGRTLVLSYGGFEEYVVDAVTNKVLHHRALYLDKPALSADGKWLIGPWLNEIRVFDAASGRKLFRLPIGEQTVQSLHVLPDGGHVFTSGRGGHACVWDLKAALPVADKPE
jgi:hypothetical protein